MNRTPPNLVYLTIYNPSLRSTSPLNDDEDAEEQAHILFYTSKERAVSRDKMLRQIGLAKALVSFSEMFDTQNHLDTVHSQTRRMIMVTPEPNFWIHACVELAKAPRVIHEKGKSKGKDKAKDKGKEKEKDKAKEGPIYDYEDSSVHDGALREGIIRGYERFKLIHGSFTVILDSLGQEALGHQLERFWTPWAWSWSLEDSQDFGQHLGIAFHSYFKALLPTLDDLQDDLPQDELTTLLLSPTSIIPSTAYLQDDYPISLPLYLASLIPLPRDPSIHSQDDDVLASSQTTIKGINIVKDQDDQSTGTTSSFLNNMQAMDMRKWNWGGVLNFGRGSGKTFPQGPDAPNVAAVAGATALSRRVSTDQPEWTMDPSSSADKTSEERKKGGDDERGHLDANDDKEGDKRSIVETTVDLNALDDAISSRVSPAPSMKERSDSSSTLRFQREAPSLPTSERIRNEARDEVGNDGIEEDEKGTIRELEMTTPKTLPMFLGKTVYLQDGDDPLSTSQRRVYFLLKGQWMLALIGSRTEVRESEVQQHLDHCSRKSEKFFEMVEEIIQEESIKSMGDSLPSAAKILQPLDVHIGSTGKYTYGSSKFHSKSGVLHDARALQDREPEILEVFSRGQNPQYWHVARRTRSPLNSPHYTTTTSGSGGAGIGLGEPLEMYMEVFKKEASLSDVDNVMAGAVKNWKGVVEEVDGL